MDELVKMIADKVGISEEQAKQAVEMVLEFLQDKLPPPFDSQLGAVLEGDMSQLDVNDLLGGLGGLLGKS